MILTIILTFGQCLSVFAFSISEIPDNTIKLGDDFFDLSSDPMADSEATVAVASLLKNGINQNVAYFKFAGKWYDPFNLSAEQFLDTTYALTEAQVNSISGFNKWYKAGSEVVDITAGPTLTAVTVGGIEPTIGGTTTAPTLTFAVDPVTKYTTGTATLSMDVNYRIQSGTDINVTGSACGATATTPDNLVVTALDTLKTVSGDDQKDGVYGSTLISRSPITITLTAGEAQTVYTISFISAGPTLNNPKVGDISPTVAGSSWAPELTFTVVPTAAYSAGNVTLSENVSYNIKNATYNINGNATTEEDLIQTALALLATNGGTGGDVLGSTLIANSPLTITIQGLKGTTVYTVKFVAQ